MKNLLNPHANDIPAPSETPQPPIFQKKNNQSNQIGHDWSIKVAIIGCMNLNLKMPPGERKEHLPTTDFSFPW